MKGPNRQLRRVSTATGIVFAVRSFTIALLWVAVAALSASAADVAFPLRTSSNGRYLVNQSGKPFFICGDSPWSLIAQPNKEDVERYLDHARRRGYNTLVVNLIESEASDNPPKNCEGIAPFTKPGDFATVNEAYFAHVDWVLRKAAEKQMLVLLFPAWASSQKAPGGWNQEILRNGPEKCYQYGRYLGQRYKNFHNIIWGHGGDQMPDASESTLIDPRAVETIRARSGYQRGGPEGQMAANMLKILKGVRSVAPEHMHFYHGIRGYSSLDQANFAPHVDLDAVYTCDDVRGSERIGECHTTSLKAFNREKFKPLFLFEGVYENVRKQKPKWGDPYTSGAPLRRQAYWAVLCGGTGHCFGNFPVWPLLPGWDGPDGLDSPGNQDMQRLKALFTSHAWWKLVPDQKHVVVIDGYGRYGKGDYVTAALAEDSSLLIAYVPSTGAKPRTLTVNLGKLNRPVTACWYNPTDGTYKAIQGSPISNASSHKFQTPGDNGTSTNDWVLVLEAREE